MPLMRTCDDSLGARGAEPLTRASSQECVHGAGPQPSETDVDVFKACVL